MNSTVDLSGLSVRHHGSAQLSGFLSRPAGEGPWPGVVVLFEGGGPDAVNRRLGERMAAAGYLALMPDLYHGRPARQCMVSMMRQLSAGEGPAYGEIEAARQWLLESEDCTGKVGVIGFCMGGGFALVLAGQGRYDVAAANYGQVPKNLHATMASACPVIANYGAKDRAFRGNAPKLKEALERAGVEHEVNVYPNAGHSFLNDADNVPPALRPLMRLIMGIRPEPESAADAWQRIDAFFAKHLASDDS